MTYSKDKIKDYVKCEFYENYPKEGVKFIDLTPSYYDIKSRNLIKLALTQIIDSLDLDLDNTIVVAPEARGFIFGSIIADRYNLPLVLARKESKFPPQSIGVSKKYKTEYSTDNIAIQKYNMTGKSVLFIDDVFATGGTYNTIKDLCQISGAKEVIPIVIYDIGISTEKVYSVF